MIIDNPTISGSALLSGSLTITGSLNVSGSISGLASNAVSASYALISTSASYALVATSASQANNANTATSASYALVATSASYSNDSTSASYALNATSASQANNANTATSASYALNATTSSYALNSTTSSFALNATSASQANNANNATSASYALNATTASYALAATSASYALVSTSASYAANSDLLDGRDSLTFANTGSNAFVGTQNINGAVAITGSLTTTGAITAQTLNVQQVTSSIVYSSGSNIFGNSISNTQSMTGSVGISGSLSVNGVSTLTGTLAGTSATFSSSVSIGGADQGYQLDVKRTSTGDSTFDTVANFYKASTHNTGLLLRLKNTIVDLAANNITGGGGPTAGMSFSVSSGGTISTALTLASTGAATFSSSIAATSATFSGNVTLNTIGAYIYTYGRFATSGGNILFNNGTGENLILAETATHVYTFGKGSAGVAPTSNVLSLNLSTGNVGIGTTSPNTKLEVVGTAGLQTEDNQQLRITAPTTTVAHGAGLRLNAASGAKEAVGIVGIVNEASGNYGSLVFHTYAGGANIPERMRITSGGNVQIGNDSNPFLYIANGGSTDVTSGINWLYGSGLVNGGGIEMAAPSGNNFYMIFKTRDSGSTSERMRITSGGDVLVAKTSADGTVVGVELRAIGLGIFTRSGGSCLQLNRNTSDGTIASFRTSDVERGSISIAGATTSYNTSSDYRLKEDLQEIKGLEKVNAIKVYDYKWKSFDSRMDGVLAHELAEIIPYAVNGVKDEVDEDGNDKMQGVDYSKLVPIMIKAIQEQQSQIEALKLLIK